ncbi:MAG: tetratricopeptide repeat protein [bacterium]|nr:tetratricopeptide repeat protein [bacterium]
MKVYSDQYPLPPGLLKRLDQFLEYKQQGDDKTARAIILSLLEESPDHPRLLNAMGTFYSDNDEFEAGEKIYLKVVNLAPDFGVVYGNLCNLYCKTGDIEKATKFADMALENGLRLPVTWDFIGIYYFKQGEYDMALEYFLTAYNMDNSFLKSAYNIACSYIKLDQPRLALEYLRPSLTELRDYRQALTDDDLNPIRELPEFEEMMKEAEEIHRNDLLGIKKNITN